MNTDSQAGMPTIRPGSDVALRPTSALAINLAGGADDRLDISSIFGTFRRRLGLIGIIVALSLLAAFVLTMRSPKLYTATADIMLRTDGANITPGSETSDDDLPKRSEQIETELAYIKSRDLAAKVLDKFALLKDPGFLAPGGFGIASMLRKATGADPLSPTETRDQGVARLLQSVDARRLGTAYALRITYIDGSPQRAALLANGYAKLFADDQVATKVAENQKAIGILKSRMDELRDQAQSDFGALQQYRIANNLQTKSGTALTEQEVSAYNQEVASARAAAAQDQARLATARAQLGRGGDNVGESTTSAVVNALRGQRAGISARVAELSTRYLEDYPDLVTARRQLADIDTQIDAEVRRAVRALEANATASQSRLGSLSGSLGAATGKLTANNVALVAMDDLERKAQASQVLYESYLNRYKEAVARSGAEQASSSILSPAAVPKSPSSPNLPLNLALGFLVGSLLGSAAAIMAESAFSGLTNGDEVERKLGAPFFGAIPMLDSIKPHSATPLETLETYPDGAFAESFRGIAAATRQSTNSRNQVIAVTSALPGEGKTTVVACMAATLARAQARVVVIDCDVVRRSLTHSITPTSGPGLRAVLLDNLPLEDAIVSDAIGCAAVLPITEPFDRGERLLQQGALHRLVAKLRERYDVIILDCAPVLPIAETRELVGLADNVIIVTRWRTTAAPAVRAALKLLPLAKLGDVGVVLNNVDMRKRNRFGGGDASVFYNQYKSYYTAA